MSKSYLCDGCLQHHNGVPFLHIERHDEFVTLADVTEWDACSWECVKDLAYEINHTITEADDKSRPTPKSVKIISPHQRKRARF